MSRSWGQFFGMVIHFALLNWRHSKETYGRPVQRLNRLEASNQLQSLSPERYDGKFHGGESRNEVKESTEKKKSLRAVRSPNVNFQQLWKGGRGGWLHAELHYGSILKCASVYTISHAVRTSGEAAEDPLKSEFLSSFRCKCWMLNVILLHYSSGCLTNTWWSMKTIRDRLLVTSQGGGGGGGFQKSVVFQNWTAQRDFEVKIIPPFQILVWKTYPPTPNSWGHNSLRPSC